MKLIYFASHTLVTSSASCAGASSARSGVGFPLPWGAGARGHLLVGRRACWGEPRLRSRCRDAAMKAESGPFCVCVCVCVCVK
jgi:hypothetical protein